MSWTCVICKKQGQQHTDFSNQQCKPGSSHVLQETIDGTRNPDDGIAADFAVPEWEKWGAEARKLYGDPED